MTKKTFLTVIIIQFGMLSNQGECSNVLIRIDLQQTVNNHGVLTADEPTATTQSSVFGDDGTNFWNVANKSAGALPSLPLKASDAPTGPTIAQFDVFGLNFTAGRTIFNASNLRNDYFGVTNSSAVPWQVSGLAPNASYELVLYGGQAPVPPGTFVRTRFGLDLNGDSVFDFSTDVGYSDDAVHFNSIKADSAGVVRGSFAIVPGDDPGTGSWSGLQLYGPQRIPEPATFALVTPLGLLLLRRRNRFAKSGVMVATLVVLLCVTTTPTHATVTIAFDSATDPAYLVNWQDGDNGGFGFQPWVFVPTTNPATAILGSSVANGDGIDDGNINGQALDADIDVFGKSWGVSFGTNGRTEFHATREFVTPLGVGERFSVDLDNGAMAGNGFLDSIFVFELGNSGGYEAELWLNPHETTYRIGKQSSGFFGMPPVSPLAFGDEGLRLEYFRDTVNTYEMTVTLRNGNSHTVSGFAGAIDRLSFAALNEGPNSHNIYLNSMRITSPIPEPSTLLFATLGLSAIALRAPRKRFL
ncbi:MAG: PEP-CTERM sorting domain-containing protein [Pirellulales bacterium]|nr:PEP-CTERM sorting domain-containing protein [Pirellulales bacterium]